MLVAEDDGQLVGFSACQVCADALHLWELAVRHEAQGRGVGKALVQATFDLARARGLPAVTLSTFREIPWNGPFYARMGFAEVPRAALNARLQVIYLREDLLGLPVDRRMFMRAPV